jgi:hypothetical protein
MCVPTKDLERDFWTQSSDSSTDEFHCESWRVGTNRTVADEKEQVNSLAIVDRVEELLLLY